MADNKKNVNDITLADMLKMNRKGKHFDELYSISDSGKRELDKYESGSGSSLDEGEAWMLMHFKDNGFEKMSFDEISEQAYYYTPSGVLNAINELIRKGFVISENK